MNEAEIFVNGVKLNEGASMTIRVALQSFAMYLHQTGLGDDATGKAICAGYLKQIGIINGLIMPAPAILSKLEQLVDCTPTKTVTNP